MDLEHKLAHVLELLDRLNVTVRHESLGGGGGGGLCRLRGRPVVFIDRDADPPSRYAAVLDALRNLDGLDALYVLPEVREDLQRISR